MGVLEGQRPQPLAARRAPGLVGPPQPVTQQELAHAVAITHPVDAGVLARTNEIAQRLDLLAGDRDRVQQPTGELARVPRIGLDPIARAGRAPVRARRHRTRSLAPADDARARSRSARPHSSSAPAAGASPRARPRPRRGAACTHPAARRRARPPSESMQRERPARHVPSRPAYSRSWSATSVCGSTGPTPGNPRRCARADHCSDR